MNWLAVRPDSSQYGLLEMGLEFYTQAQDLRHLADSLTRPAEAAAQHAAADPRGPSPATGTGAAFARRFGRLSRGLCELVEDYGLVSFVLLDIQDRDSVEQVRVPPGWGRGAALHRFLHAGSQILPLSD